MKETFLFSEEEKSLQDLDIYEEATQFFLMAYAQLDSASRAMKIAALKVRVR